MLVLEKNWWALVLRGIAGVIFGVLCFAYPITSIAALLLLFGIYAIADGVFNIVAAVRGARAHQRWGPLLAAGVISLAAGIYTLFKPGMTGLVLLYVIAGWAFANGALGLAAAFRLRRERAGEWRLGLAAILSIALGVVIVAYPSVSALAFLFWYGSFAIVFGITLIALGFWLHSQVRARPPEFGSRLPA